MQSPKFNSLYQKKKKKETNKNRHFQISWCVDSSHSFIYFSNILLKIHCVKYVPELYIHQEIKEDNVNQTTTLQFYLTLARVALGGI